MTKFYDKLVQQLLPFLETKSNVAATLFLVWAGLKTDRLVVNHG